jgi:hypothetical protein
VSLGDAGFHESFTSTEEALNFIAWCYSGEARVREVCVAGRPRRRFLKLTRTASGA